MTTVLIIVCIVFCIGVVFAIVSHMGYGIAADRGWRSRIHRHHESRKDRRSRLTAE
jgi:hypothetical protein